MISWDLRTPQLKPIIKNSMIVKPVGFVIPVEIEKKYHYISQQDALKVKL